MMATDRTGMPVRAGDRFTDIPRDDPYDPWDGTVTAISPHPDFGALVYVLWNVSEWPSALNPEGVEYHSRYLLRDVSETVLVHPREERGDR